MLILTIDICIHSRLVTILITKAGADVFGSVAPIGNNAPYEKGRNDGLRLCHS